MKNIILASGSPRRRELLTQIGIDYKVIVSDADESIAISQPEELVKELSYIKAKAVYDSLEDNSDTLVIGADTIVYHQGKVLGKPGSPKEAYDMLSSMSGATHSVYTGVTFVTEGRRHSFYEETEVSFYDLSEEELRQYIASKDPFDKAGGYGIQGWFARFVKGIRGDYNNVVGLPAGRVYQELKNIGEI